MNFLMSILALLGMWLAPFSPPKITFPIATTTSTSTSVVVTPSTTSTVPASTTSTLAVPVTTTTTLAAVPADDIWWALALCEDGGKNRVFGQYHGYFHFLVSTWQNIGGSGSPEEHDYDTQKSFAIKLQRQSGWGQWPGCARQLGLL